MKTITKLEKAAPYVFLIFIVAFTSILSFFKAGHSFMPVAIWGILLFFIFIVWFLAPKNWSILSSHKAVIIFGSVFGLLFFINFFIYPYSNFGFTTFVLFFSMFALFLMSLTIRWEKAHIRWILHTLCLLALFISIYGIQRFVEMPFHRITGPFYIQNETNEYFPNAFALFLMLILPIQTLYLMNQSENSFSNLRKIYFYFSSVVIFTAFLMVFSRTAIITLFVLSFIFIIIQLTAAVKKKELFKGRAIRSLLAILVLSFFMISVVNWVRSFNYEITSFDVQLSLNASENTVSFFDRFDSMEAGILMASEYPLFGVGVNNFKFFYPDYQNAPLISEHPYNFMVKVAAENGISAFIFALAFIVSVLVFFLNKSKYVEQKYYTGALAFSLVAAGVYNLLDYELNFILISALIGLFLGLMLSRFEIKEKVNAITGKLFTAGMLVLVIIVSVTSAHELYAGRTIYFDDKIKKSSEDYLMAADNRWFKEDLYIKTAKILRDEYIKQKNETLLNEWLNIAQKATEIHELNPKSWYLYAEALCRNESYREASKMYEKSLQIDPKNHLKFYYGYLKCKIANDSVDREFISLLKKVLKKYNAILSSNPYLIESCDNYDYAGDIYRTLKTRTEKWDTELDALYHEFLDLTLVGKRGLEPPPSDNED